MVIIYQLTGKYIDISNYYNILDLFPNIFDYTGSNITDKPYELANTIYILIYYTHIYIIFPFWNIMCLIIIIKLRKDIKNIVSMDKKSESLQRYYIFMQYFKECSGIAITGDWAKIKILGFILVSLLFMYWAIATPEMYFEEEYSTWIGIGTISLDYGAYYILFPIFTNFMNFAVFQTMMWLGICLTFITSYYEKYL